MGGVDLCEQREAKTGGGRSISVDREAKTGGAIDCCEAADFCCGGDPSVIKERQIGGGDFCFCESLGGGNGSRGIGGLDREERELGSRGIGGDL